MRKHLLSLTLGLLLLITLPILIVQSQQLKTVRDILNDVWDRTNHQLMGSPWIGGLASGQSMQTEQTIYNDVWDQPNHMLRVSATGGGGSGGAFNLITSGTNTGQTLTVGNGSILSPSGTGIVKSTVWNTLPSPCGTNAFATGQDTSGNMICTPVPFTGLSGAASDAQIPDLNTLSTSLTPNRCVETDGTGKLTSAAATCGTGSGGGAFSALTSGTNTSAAMLVGTGASLGATGSGTITATSTPFSGVTAGTTVGQALLIGNGSSLAATGTGTITATTAGALSADPPPCSTNRFVTDTAANGTLTCTQPSLNDLSDKATILTSTSTHIVENKQNVLREVLYTPVANAITPNCDTTDVVVVNTIAANLTINDPVCTGSNPRPSQEITFRFFCSALRTFTWGTSYSTEAGIPMLTACTGDGTTYDYAKYIRNSVTSKWDLVATKATGKGVTTLASSAVFTCPVDNAAQCQMSMTEVAGTLTIAQPTGTPTDGQMLMLLFRCNNLQSLTFNAIFVASPNVPIPTSCPADTTKFTAVGARYSTILTKWQVLASN